MNTLGKRAFIFLSVVVGLILGGYVLFENITFQLTRKETTGTVVGKEHRRKTEVSISYFNEYKGAEVVKTISIGHLSGNDISIGQQLQVYYQKYSNSIYTDINPPPSLWAIAFFVIPFVMIIYLIIPTKVRSLR